MRMRFDPRVFVLVEGPFVDVLRRRLRDSNLHLAINRATRYCCVAERKGTWLNVLVPLGQMPVALSREVIDQVQSMRYPRFSRGDVAAQEASDDRTLTNQLQDMNTAFQEDVSYFKRRGL